MNNNPLTKFIYKDISEFRNKTNGKRLLSLDIGDKTIGLAISDDQQQIITPIEVIKRRKFTSDAQYIIEIIKTDDIAGLVIGWPIHLDGSEGKRCQSTRQFAYNLLKLHEIPIYFQDERYSSDIASDMLDMKQNADKIDAIAAQIILERFIIS